MSDGPVIDVSGGLCHDERDGQAPLICVYDPEAKWESPPFEDDGSFDAIGPHIFCRCEGGRDCHERREGYYKCGRSAEGT